MTSDDLTPEQARQLADSLRENVTVFGRICTATIITVTATVLAGKIG